MRLPFKYFAIVKSIPFKDCDNEIKQQLVTNNYIRKLPGLLQLQVRFYLLHNLQLCDLGAVYSKFEKEYDRVCQLTPPAKYSKLYNCVEVKEVFKYDLQSLIQIPLKNITRSERDQIETIVPQFAEVEHRMNKMMGLHHFEVMAHFVSILAKKAVEVTKVLKKVLSDCITLFN